jgi:cytochrome c oxidase cbb3-type subunit III
MNGRCIAMAVFAAAALLGCEREMRRFSKPADPTPPQPVRMVELQPGEKGDGPRTQEQQRFYDERNAYDMSQGKRWFRWFNCAGCHSNGGGGMGPALMDDTWLYGKEPQQIYTTIMDGRPNGMPSFRGRIQEDQVWQLVAYVRSMSGLMPSDAAPGRSDSMAAKDPESRAKKGEAKP